MFDFLSKAGDSVMDSLSNVGETVGNGLSHVFEKLQDPEFQQQAGLFAAAMSNDQGRYQNALNAYDQRRQQIAAQKREDMQREQARKEKLEDLKNQREYDALVREQGYERQDSLRMQDREWQLADKETDRAFQAANRAPRQSRTQVIDGVLYEEQGSGNWVPVAGTSKSEAENAAGVTLSDGTTINTVGMHRTLSGDLVQVERSASGKLMAKVPTKAMREQYEAQNTAADETLMNDLNVLKGAADNEYIMTAMTGMGGDVGELADGADIYSKYSRFNPFSDKKNDEALREAVVSGQRLNQSMENMGIAQAKALGASGINTAEEAKRFGASMPKVDYSNTAAYKSSMKAIETYVNNYNAKKSKVAPAMDTQARKDSQPAAKYPDGTVLTKGGKTYVVQGGKPVLQG